MRKKRLGPRANRGHFILACAGAADRCTNEGPGAHGAQFQIAGKASFQGHQFAVVAGAYERTSGSRVGLFELLVESGGVFLGVLRNAGNGCRNMQRLIGLTDGMEVVARGESRINSVALPFVLHQFRAGIEIESVADHFLSDGSSMLAGLIETSLLTLRPEAVNDESDVAPDAALVCAPRSAWRKSWEPRRAPEGSSQTSQRDPAAGGHWGGCGCRPRA